MVEVILVAYIIQAWSLNCPLSISKTIAIMNSFIIETAFEELVIAWKTKRGILNPNTDVPLVGWKWWLLFKRRNPEIETKAGRKWARNRSDQCHDTPLQKMYNQLELGLIESGCCSRFEQPVHMDIKGWIVDNEADGYGRLVTIKYQRARNRFLIDETSDNAHGKDNCKRGGKQMVVPCGEIPNDEVGVNNSITLSRLLLI